MTDNNIVSVAAGAKVKTRITSSSPVSDVFGDTHLHTTFGGDIGFW